MSEFLQIIRFATDVDPDKIIELRDEYRAATADRSAVGSGVFGRDLDNGDYVMLVTFPSRDAADANNALPETQALAQQMAALAKAPPTFSNLEVIDKT